MTMMPILWIIWGVFAVALAGLLIYRGRLTLYEEDQIFLDESSHQHEVEQASIVHQVQRLQPIVRGVTGAACLLTALIIGVYVWEAVRQFTM